MLRGAPSAVVRCCFAGHVCLSLCPCSPRSAARTASAVTLHLPARLLVFFLLFLFSLFAAVRSVA